MIKRALTSIAVALALLPGLEPATAETPHSRVIVSTTLNSTLNFFDATTLEQTQPPLLSRGLGPVRLWVEDDHLFVANHGAVSGSLGVFDLSADLVLERPASPVPTGGLGSVGVAAARDGDAMTVWVTNSTFALGGCSMPNGSVSAFDGSMLDDLGVVTPLGSADLTAAIPYAVAAHGDTAYVSTNCGDTLETVELGSPLPVHGATRATGAGPDAVLYDTVRDLIYTTNIGGDSVSVHDPSTPEARTTVPVGDGPIDATLAGERWLITGNGSDDTISVVDRDLIAACVDAAVAICDAEIARHATDEPDGAPEGVAYDPVTNRVYVVNKPIGAPSLSVLQLDENGGLAGYAPESPVALNALGADVPGIPAIIAFDVVVQTR